MHLSIASEQAALKLAKLAPDCLHHDRAVIVQDAINAALEGTGFGRSSFGLTYHSLRGEESSGTHGAFGLRIAYAHKDLPHPLLGRDPALWTPEEKAISDASYDAVDKLTDALMTYAISRDPAAQTRRAAERAQIVGLFPLGCFGFVEEIPNGYDSRWGSKHLPWFVVTTSVGRIKLGWRKRVISIDWTETQGTKDSTELFAAEDVTKDKRLIHAWSLDKARDYIAAIIGSERAPSPAPVVYRPLG